MKVQSWWCIGLALATCTAVHSQKASPDQLNEVFEAPFFLENSLWSEADSDVAGRLGLAKESRTDNDSSFRLYPPSGKSILGSRPFSIALYGRDGMVESVSMVFANKGDVIEMVEIDSSLSEARQKLELQRVIREFPKWIAEDAREISSRLTALLGEPQADRFGQGRAASERVQRWDWNGHAILLAAPRGEYVAVRIVPTETADGEARDRVGKLELRDELADRVERRDNGDVVLTGIPMVDQGPKGYCVPATWERALRYLGIPADMYALAMAGATDAGGGTSVANMMYGVNDLVRQHGRRLVSTSGRISTRMVARYIDAGIPLMWSMYSMPEMHAPVTLRSVLRRDTDDWEGYGEMLESVRQDARKIRTDREYGHVCMIVGYNNATGEIAISDSWGPQYAERWITEEEANAVSQGSFVAVSW